MTSCRAGVTIKVKQVCVFVADSKSNKNKIKENIQGANKELQNLKLKQ